MAEDLIQRPDDIPANNPLEMARVDTACTQWLSGSAKCMHCGCTWTAAAPVGTLGLECPSCGLNRGYFCQPAAHVDEPHYRCACGSEAFCLTQQRVYCPNCGRSHRPFDDADFKPRA